MGRNSTCNSCGATIRWITLVGGRRMPINAMPSEKGNITCWEVDGETYGRVLPQLDLATLPPDVPRYVSHFATCPSAQKHRGKGGK